LGKLHKALEKLEKEEKTSKGVSHSPFLRADVQDPPVGAEILEDSLDVGYPESKISPDLVAFQKPHSFESEQFNMLKSLILFPQSGSPPRSIMITSVTPGEGKSFVASNLAVSIARNINEHVLLMDCDLRRPSIHNIFGFGRIDGLSEHLSKERSLASVLHKTIVSKLTILPGGSPPHNPSELLASEKMLGLLKEVKSKYSDRYIIIDSPPLPLASEVNVIARKVDAVILVIKYGKTKRESIEEVVEMIGRKKVLGVVFNYFDVRSLQHAGYGKYSSYSKYISRK
jgi:exopolysaccharide/PEP-CTERM locus tyrosine autokinase